MTQLEAMQLEINRLREALQFIATVEVKAEGRSIPAEQYMREEARSALKQQLQSNPA